MTAPTPDRPADEDLRRVVALVTMLRGYGGIGRSVSELLGEPAAGELLAEGKPPRKVER